MSGTKSDSERVPVHGRRMHFMCDNLILKPEARLHGWKRDIFPLICGITVCQSLSLLTHRPSFLSPSNKTINRCWKCLLYMTPALQKAVLHCFPLWSNQLTLSFICSKVLGMNTERHYHSHCDKMELQLLKRLDLNPVKVQPNKLGVNLLHCQLHVI